MGEHGLICVSSQSLFFKSAIAKERIHIKYKASDSAASPQVASLENPVFWLLCSGNLGYTH